MTFQLLIQLCLEIPSSKSQYSLFLSSSKTFYLFIWLYRVLMMAWDLCCHVWIFPSSLHWERESEPLGHLQSPLQPLRKLLE